MRALLFILALIPLLFSCSSPATESVLRPKIELIIKDKKAEVGVAIREFDSNDMLSFNGDKQFTIMSVVKFPVGLAILQQVDKGKFRLDQRIRFEKAELDTNMYSPMMDKLGADSGFEVSLLEVLKYAVSESDNIACDKLFSLLGSPKVVEDYVHQLGIKDIGIATTYAQMKSNGIAANHSSPKAMAALLEKFYQGNILSDTSRKVLLKLMTETETGLNRIKGLLPAGTVVAHKTGTMATDTAQFAQAFNDVGIVELPNGKHIAVVVFVSNSHETEETNARIIAEIARAAYDHFSRK